MSAMFVLTSYMRAILLLVAATTISALDPCPTARDGALFLRPTWARCELLGITPGASAASVETLQRACAALAAAGCDRLLVREPTLGPAQVEALVEAVVPLFPPGGIVVHEKCANAREIAHARGLGLHLRSTSDWRAERAAWRGPLGASAHSLEELRLAASLGLEWAFFSPVARPTSKPGDLRPTIGEAAVANAQGLLPGLRIYGLGGISPAAAERLALHGVRGVAVLGGLFPSWPETTPEAAEAVARQYSQALTAAAAAAAADDDRWWLKRKEFVASFIGVYNFEYAGGQFEVHLRPAERFFAPLYQAKSKWSFDADGKMMTVDFAKYGMYELRLEDEVAKTFVGAAKGNSESWRKMIFKRPFTKAELMLFDSLWEFQHPRGSFSIEFRADAFNHFVCDDFPAHSHWKCVLAAPRLNASKCL